MLAFGAGLAVGWRWARGAGVTVPSHASCWADAGGCAGDGDRSVHRGAAEPGRPRRGRPQRRDRDRPRRHRQRSRPRHEPVGRVRLGGRPRLELGADPRLVLRRHGDGRRRRQQPDDRPPARVGRRGVGRRRVVRRRGELGRADVRLDAGGQESDRRLLRRVRQRRGHLCGRRLPRAAPRSCRSRRRPARSATRARRDAIGVCEPNGSITHYRGRSTCRSRRGRPGRQQPAHRGLPPRRRPA